MPVAAAALMEVRNISKYYGNVVALNNISLNVNAGEVLCLLGDNGAGKSTMIKILSGVHRADEGEVLINGERVTFRSPADALNHGIAAVQQNLSIQPLMSVTRNFFLGREPEKGWGPFRRFDLALADSIVREEMARMGIDIRDPGQHVGTMSGGERQCVAISRAVYFGARVLILDEPTSALGVKQAGVVLRYIAQARARGLGVIFITHNVHHAYPVADRFTIFRRGQSYGNFQRDEVTREEVLEMMAGGQDLGELEAELREFRNGDDAGSPAEQA
jgi:simple sugar transport system ATP-binding protein